MNDPSTYDARLRELIAILESTREFLNEVDAAEALPNDRLSLEHTGTTFGHLGNIISRMFRDAMSLYWYATTAAIHVDECNFEIYKNVMSEGLVRMQARVEKLRAKKEGACS